MAIFLDIETTGLPIMPGWNKFYPPTNLKMYDPSRVVQLAMMLCTDKLQPVEKVNLVIRSDGFSIPNPEFHGITQEISDNIGVPISDAGDILLSWLSRASHIFAHNGDFDVTILTSEFHRIGRNDVVKALTNASLFCTMNNTKLLVNTKNPNGFTKNPSLKELYEFATQKTICDQHDAMGDVKSMHEAIITLVQSGRLELPLLTYST